MKNKLFLIFFGLLFSITSCKVVENNEKIDLNDPDMVLNDRKVNNFSTKFHNYREGSSGAKGVKSVGGCGCN